MNPGLLYRWLRHLCTGLCLAVLAGCASLLPQAPAAPARYELGASPGRAALAADAAPGPPGPLAPGPTLLVNPPRAAAGLDSRDMLYLRQAHRLEAFAHSEWVEAPARMILQPVVAELQRSDKLRSVVSAPSAAAADWRLDIELLQLHQDFTVAPSAVRLRLRATLVDVVTRRVVAWQEFDHSAVAPQDDAYGGVLAAQAALKVVLVSLRGFCDDSASRWEPAPARR